jgi:hypothetical protein
MARLIPPIRLRLLSRTRGLVSRGYAIEVPDAADRAVFVARAPSTAPVVLPIGRDALVERYRDHVRGGVAVILPTVLGRATFAGHLDAALHMARQLSRLRQLRPAIPAAFVVGLQYDGADQAPALDRLVQVLSRACADERACHPELLLLGLVLPARHKVATLNAAFTVLRDLGPAAIGWTDDDVRFDDGSWARMAGAFLASGARGAAGAVKRGVPGRHRAARVLHRLKAITRPVIDVPHGCAILVDARLLERGIPRRYTCDDGYVCFENLRPDRPDPLGELRLVPGATCFHVVGGRAGQTLRRQRRMLLHHIIFLADYPADVARVYFRDLLFHGLWPLAPFDASRGVARGVAKQVIKLLHFGWFAAVWTELLARGLAGRPLRDVPWGGHAGREVPP